jgi:hypothetical protein
MGWQRLMVQQRLMFLLAGGFRMCVTRTAYKNTAAASQLKRKACPAALIKNNFIKVGRKTKSAGRGTW